MIATLRGHWDLWPGAPHRPDKSCDHKHCDNGDIMFLICRVNTCLKSYINL